MEPSLPEDVFAEISRHCDAKTWRSLALASRATWRALSRPAYLQEAKLRLGTDVVEPAPNRPEVEFTYHLLPNGQIHGTRYARHVSQGTVVHVSHYVHGKREGIEELFLPIGEKVLFRRWIDDKPDCEWMHHSNGRPKILAFNFDADKTCVCFEWDETGFMTNCYRTLNRLQHGIEEKWQKDGKRYERNQWLNGNVQTMELVQFNDDGTFAVETIETPLFV